MILFFRSESKAVIAVKTICEISDAGNAALEWLFSGAKLVQSNNIDGIFIGPRKEMITPWSTTAVEIVQNMNIGGIERIEEFFEVSSEEAAHDKMLQRVYKGLNQETFEIKHAPEPLLYIEDLAKYNESEGLALSPEELEYLENLSKKLDRKLTDSEVFGFSQVNSEHCRHKIFNGKFIIDGVEMESTLFKLIKKTSQENPNRIVSAYKDNCAFVEGPKVKMFYPKTGDKPDVYVTSDQETVISLKAETHNFPTTVEPFNGAATGSGGEIRDRMAGGTGSFPVAGTAVYMTSYPRFDVEGRDWESNPGRDWLYQTPQEILTKASNGASDFGNKFGQALICGSLFTFEYYEGWKNWGYDKVIMQAGGIGYAKKSNAIKGSPQTGDKVVVMGGDNYRIGMGGGAVSSVATGEFDNAIEMNAVQRSNPEMQKRVYNAIRSLAEGENNTIVSVHDHGAGGHLNSLSELVEETGGTIEIDKLPIGDPTLSSKEIIGNESQERMGLVMKAADIENLRKIAERERAPMYVVGEATGKHNFTLVNNKNGEKAIDLDIKDFFGSTPVTVMEDTSVAEKYDQLEYDIDDIEYYLEQVLQIEAVACKDWLTNKVDRSVSGLIATQQTAGEIQLPLNDLGVTAIGYNDYKGISTSVGHAPAVALIDAEAGSRMAIAEALTNIVWGPLEGGLKGVSLSANWMWPCRNPGEDTRLYNAVKAASDFAIELGINIPTGKDSLSMTQKYPNGERVLAPGTLIVSGAGECSDIRKVVKPVLAKDKKASIIYIPFTCINETTYELGGSSFAQITGQLGNGTPDVADAGYFSNCFGAVQKMVDGGLLLAGHDISAGGLITALLEMNFANKDGGIDIFLREIDEKDPVRMLFSEAAGVVIQVAAKNLEKVMDIADNATIHVYEIGNWNDTGKANITLHKHKLKLDINEHRDVWFRTSYLFDSRQSGDKHAIERFSNYKAQPLVFDFPHTFEGKLSAYNILKDKGKAAPVAAIIREKGSNGDREMAWALHLAGFTVKDVHMTDLISGRETLEEVKVIAFVGGFSNADTLGSAKGWAGAFLYNEKAKNAIDKFYARKDTLSLGVCNGCQLMAELGLITPENREASPKMGHNDSHKYESAFVGVEVTDSPSIMLSTLTGSKLGIWVAHGEGKFLFPADTSGFKTALKFNYNSYPANPNGSPGAVAGICSTDGRHLAMMPHPERCTYPHNWAHYPADRRDDQVSPWFEIFLNAREWIDKNS
jgi:phosphoribosylformylglycinamidine synthase